MSQGKIMALLRKHPNKTFTKRTFQDKLKIKGLTRPLAVLRNHDEIIWEKIGNGYKYKYKKGE